MELLLFKISLLTIILYCLYHWALRGNTFFRFNRFYMLGGIVLAVVFPFIPFHYQSDSADMIDLSEGISWISNAVSIEMKINSSIDFGQIFRIIYLAGIIILSLLRIGSISRLLKCISKGTRTVASGFTLVETSAVKTSFSFLRYIVLPQGMDEADKKVILVHEKTHIRQRHYIDLFLGDLFCIIQWFNPFAWFYKRDLAENHDFLADKEGRNVSGIDSYKDTLTRYWLYGTMKSLVNPFASSTRLMRLSMLKKPSSPDIHKYWVACLIPLLSVYAWAFAVPVSPDRASDIQRVTIMGTITNEKGDKIVAASVIAPHTSAGTISDMDGHYILSVENQDTVYISMDGYEKQRICVAEYPVAGTKVVINVQLQTAKINAPTSKI